MGFLGSGGQGANAFAQNFMQAYLGLRKDNREQANEEIMNQLRQMQLSEAERKKALGEEMSRMTQPQYQPHFNLDPEAAPNQLTPTGEARLQGLMENTPQTLPLDRWDATSPEAGAPSVNPAYAPAYQKAMSQITQEKGQETTPEFDISKSFMLLAKVDPEKAMELGVKLKTAKDTTELKQAMLDVKESLAKVGFSYKEKEIELKEKFLEWKEKNADKQLDFNKWKALLAAAKGEKSPEAKRAYDLWAGAKVKRGEKAPDFDFFYEKVYKSPNAASYIFGGITPPGATTPQKLEYNPKTGKFE